MSRGNQNLENIPEDTEDGLPLQSQLQRSTNACGDHDDLTDGAYDVCAKQKGGNYESFHETTDGAYDKVQAESASLLHVGRTPESAQNDAAPPDE